MYSTELQVHLGLCWLYVIKSISTNGSFLKSFQAELSLEVHGLPTEDTSWKLNLSFTEYHVYSIIDKYCCGLNFRQVLVLFNILREENREALGIINNEILVNALFNVSQKHIDNIRKTSQWVFKLLQAIIDGLKSGFLPSFYLPRMNLLACYSIQIAERQRALECLQTIVTDITENPENIFKHTGFELEGDAEQEMGEQILNEENQEQQMENNGLIPNGRVKGNGYVSSKGSRAGYTDSQNSKIR